MKWQELKRKFDKKLTTLIARTSYKRKHCWPGIGDKVDFIRYKKAVEWATPFCYYGPIGWLPWSKYFIEGKYARTNDSR